MFRHFRVILRELVINTLLSYTGILYNDQQMHNYFTNYHTATCFDSTVSSSGSSQSVPCQVTQVFQMQLLVVQFIIKMFHTGFAQVLTLYSLKSQYYKIFQTLKLSCFGIKLAKIIMLLQFS